MKVILTTDRATEILNAFELAGYAPPADLVHLVASKCSALIDSGTLAAWKAGLHTRITDATPGERGYESYRVAIGGKAFNGDDLPSFKKIPEKIQAAWEVAACAILQHAPCETDPRSPDLFEGLLKS